MIEKLRLGELLFVPAMGEKLRVFVDYNPEDKTGFVACVQSEDPPELSAVGTVYLDQIECVEGCWELEKVLEAIRRGFKADGQDAVDYLCNRAIVVATMGLVEII